MIHLEQAVEEAGADIQESGEAAQGISGTPLTNPSQVSEEYAPDPELVTSAEHTITTNGSPARNGSNSSTVPNVLGQTSGSTKRNLENSSEPADGLEPVDGEPSSHDEAERHPRRHE